MAVEFAASAQSSVGIEWELSFVDADTFELSPRADDVLALLGVEGQSGPIRREYLLSMVELVSGAHATVGEAVADIRESLDCVRDAAASLGLRVIGGGTHPTSRSSDIPIFQAPRPIRVLDRNGWWGRRLTISGTHVHVGMANRDEVLPVTEGLARFYPYLLALSASSPFWEGEDTAFASHRTMLFQQLPTNGLPPMLTTWREFEDYAEELASVGMIEEAQEIRWDVRPAPRFGTIENRAMDSVPTLAELGCVAAITQCFVEFATRRMEDVDFLPPWIVRENKWRAARYGLDAQVIVPRYYEQRVISLRDGLTEWLGLLAPIADELGCADELALAHQIMADGPSYERQRRVAAESGVEAVAGALVAELESGTLPR